MVFYAIVAAVLAVILGLGWMADRRRRGWDTSRDSRSPGDPYANGKGAQVNSTFNSPDAGGFGGF